MAVSWHARHCRYALHHWGIYSRFLVSVSKDSYSKYKSDYINITDCLHTPWRVAIFLKFYDVQQVGSERQSYKFPAGVIHDWDRLRRPVEDWGPGNQSKLWSGALITMGHCGISCINFKLHHKNGCKSFRLEKRPWLGYNRLQTLLIL